VYVRTAVSWEPLQNIVPGMLILSKTGYTKVKGIYKGRLTVKESPKNPDWISDGVWIYSDTWKTNEDGIQTRSSNNTLDGIMLITEEGTFYVKTKYGNYIVRDFTEVGSRISESYSWLDEAINKKL